MNECSVYKSCVLFADCVEVGSWWNYKNVISPFHRIYLIESGCAAVTIDSCRYELKAGDLFLIPKFTFHSYECPEAMTHSFICCTDEFLTLRNFDIRGKWQLKTQASDLDKLLMHRFLALNPDIKLPSVEPDRYTSKCYLVQKQGAYMPHNLKELLESNGILMQLFSRFMLSGETSVAGFSSNNEKLYEILQYIEEHISEKIKVSTLSDIACLNIDYFSKEFKRLLGVTPTEYIQNKRIKNAQFFLLTSNLRISEIAELVGMTDLSQFSRMFLRLVGCSPTEYRKHLLV